MDPGKGLNAGWRKTFTPKTLPGKGGVDGGKVSAAFQLASQLEVMEDTKDSLNDSHERLGGPSGR
jgi:hypothetical protein